MWRALRRVSKMQSIYGIRGGIRCKHFFVVGSTHYNRPKDGLTQAMLRCLFLFVTVRKSRKERGDCLHFHPQSHHK